MFTAIADGLRYTSPERWSIEISRPHWGASYWEYLQGYLGTEPSGWPAVWATRPEDDLLQYVDGRLCWVWGAGGLDGSATLLLPVTQERMEQYASQIPAPYQPPAVLVVHQTTDGHRETLGGPLVFEATRAVCLLGSLGGRDHSCVLRAPVVYLTSGPARLLRHHLEGVEAVVVNCPGLYPYRIVPGYEHDSDVYTLQRECHHEPELWARGVQQLAIWARVGEDPVLHEYLAPGCEAPYQIAFWTRYTWCPVTNTGRVSYLIYPKGRSSTHPPLIPEGMVLEHAGGDLQVYVPITRAKSARSVIN